MSNSALRLACVVDEPFPSRDTLTVQVVHTLSALAHAGASIDLFVPVRPGASRDGEALRRSLEDWYHLPCPFEVIPVRGHVSDVRAVDKPAQALLAAPQALKRRYDALYSRIALPALGALTFRRPVLFETYRPLTRQYPPSKLLFKAAARQKAFLGVVTHSEYTRRAFIEDGMPAEKVRTIYNGYNGELFAERLTPEEARAKLGWAEGPTVVYAGRIAPLKRIDLFLAAARALPQANFVLAGANDTEEARPFVEEAASLPNVICPGYLSGSELPRALQAADILVIPPSLAPLQKFGNTVLPIKVFQYLAAGRAIVTGDTPDTAELLVDHVNSARVKPDDEQALIDRIRALLDSPETRERLGHSARTRAADLTWDARAGRLIEFFQERLAAHR